MCEWMGWKDLYTVHNELVGLPPFLQQPTETTHRTCPDYLSDDSPRRLLNEAEAKLNDADQWHYQCNLFLIICGRKEGKFTHKECFAVRSANARQRVIGILRVVQPELFL